MLQVELGCCRCLYSLTFLEEVFSETGHSPGPIGLRDIDSGGRVGLGVGALGQALLVKLQLRFSTADHDGIGGRG